MNDDRYSLKKVVAVLRDVSFRESGNVSQENLAYRGERGNELNAF